MQSFSSVGKWERVEKLKNIITQLRHELVKLKWTIETLEDDVIKNLSSQSPKESTQPPEEWETAILAAISSITNDKAKYDMESSWDVIIKLDREIKLLDREIVKHEHIIQILKDDIVKRYASTNWVTMCPFCKGSKSHCDWCPWLAHEIQSYPEKAATLKFICKFCNGVLYHTPECSGIKKISSSSDSLTKPATGWNVNKSI